MILKANKSRTITVIGFILVISSLIWMDACLYFNIRLLAKQVSFQYDEANVSSSSVKFPIKLMDKFSFAFNGMSIKLMMTDPVDNYIFAPLSEAFVDLFNLRDNFLYITPNIISYFGVICALIAAKLVSSNNFSSHKLSFFMFQMRTWLDDLDGDLARSRMGIRKRSSLEKTSGYMIDGFCDGIGFVAYILGCYLFLRNVIRKLDHVNQVAGGECYNLNYITSVKSRKCKRFDSFYVSILEDCEENDLLQPIDYEEATHIGNIKQNKGDIEDHGKEDINIHELNRKDIFSKTKEQEEQTDKCYHLNEEKDLGLTKVKTKPKTKYFKEFSHLIKTINLRSGLDENKLILLITCFLLQVGVSALFWNRYIIIYRDILESPSNSQYEAKAKSEIIKSNYLYILIWFWRLTNGHSLMQMLVISVLFGRIWSFLNLIKYLGFIEIFLLVTLTELHTTDVINYISIWL